MNRERAQALVEAVVALPACVACALVLVDCGVIVRDRIAVAQAATRAAEAHLAGADELAAARTAAPRAELSSDGDTISVRLTSRAAIARLAGHPVTQRSSVELEAAR